MPEPANKPEPKSIFELNLFETTEEAQAALDLAPFEKGVLHLPEIEALDKAVEVFRAGRGNESQRESLPNLPKRSPNKGTPNYEAAISSVPLGQISDSFYPEVIDRRLVLREYQRLLQSARSSLIICGQVTSGHACGGIMDIEVTPFGAFYQCRSNTVHRFTV